MATRDNGSKVTISKNGFAFMKNPAMSKNVVELTEYENPRQRLLEYKSNTFDSNIQVRIIYDGILVF
jgi:hypothetical protein